LPNLGGQFSLGRAIKTFAALCWQYTGYVPDDALFGHQTFQLLNSSFKPGCAQNGTVNAVVELQTRYANGR